MGVEAITGKDVEVAYPGGNKRAPSDAPLGPQGAVAAEGSAGGDGKLEKNTAVAMQAPSAASAADSKKESKKLTAQRVPTAGDIAVLGLGKSTRANAKHLSNLKPIFESRGFSVLAFAPDSQDESKYVMVLRVSNNLLRHAAPRLGLSPEEDGRYSMLDRNTVVTALVDVVQKCLRGYVYKDVLLLHDDEALQETVEHGSTKSLAQYCGTEVALYFEWVRYYTKLLVLPAFLGGVLFLYEVFSEEKEKGALRPLFNVALAVWGTILLEGWKRQNAGKAFEWGVLDRPTAMHQPKRGTRSSNKKKKGRNSRNYSSGLFLYGLSLPILFAIILLLVRMMLSFIRFSDHAHEQYPAGHFMRYVPTLIYSTVPSIAQEIYSRLVVLLTDWEGHSTDETYRSSLQMKLFAFHFVNSYCSLFYIAFWLQDMQRLQSMLMTLLVTKQITRQITQAVKPSIKMWMYEAQELEAGRTVQSRDALSHGNVRRMLKGPFIAVARKAIRMYHQAVDAATHRGQKDEEDHEGDDSASESDSESEGGFDDGAEERGRGVSSDGDNTTHSKLQQQRDGMRGRSLHAQREEQLARGKTGKSSVEGPTLKNVSRTDEPVGATQKPSSGENKDAARQGRSDSDKEGVDQTRKQRFESKVAQEHGGDKGKADSVGSNPLQGKDEKARSKDKEKKHVEEEKVPLIEDESVLAAVDAQRELDEYDADSEHIELLQQFGYVSLFSVAFPLAPLLALVNNIYEAHADLLKLKATRRPPARLIKDLGGWYTGLEVMAYISVLTNCTLMAMVNVEQVRSLLPSGLRFLTESALGRVVVAVAVEHALLALKFALSALIPDVPDEVQHEMEQRALRQLQELAPKSKKGLDASNTRSEPSHVTAAKHRARDHITAAELEDRIESGTWTFNPLLLLLFALVPYITTQLGLSYYWTFGLLFLVVSYIFNTKIKRDRKTAMQLATDPLTVKAVTQHLPPWYFDSQVERATFISGILQKVWVHASAIADKAIDQYVQPIINEYVPAVLGRMEITRCNLGTIPPQITGIRYVDTEEDVVRLDIDASWAGNPSIRIEVGYKGVPLVMILSKIQFRGKLRVELNPLLDDIPGIGAVVLTFMEDPFIDFSFKVAGVNVAAMGIPHMDVASLVSKILREQVLRDILLYPSQLVVPLVDLENVEKLQTPNPVARLRVMVLSARKLKAADWRKSDPYVKITYKPKNQVHRTAVKNGTLDPDFGEEFWLNIYDRSQPVLFEVKDHDMVGPNDPLGHVQINVEDLEELKETEMDLPLTDVDTGSLKLNLRLEPVQRPEDVGKVVDNDEDDTIEDWSLDGIANVGLGDDDIEDETKQGLACHNLVHSPEGLLSIESVQLLGYQGKAGLLNKSRIYLRIGLENTEHHTKSKRNPVTDPAFKGPWTFNLHAENRQSPLEVTIVEPHRMSGSKVIGRTTIDLQNFTRRPGKIETDWPISCKGRDMKLHFHACYAVMPEGR